MKYINKITPIVIIVSLIAIAILMVDYERTIDYQKNYIKLLQDEQSEKEYYQKQYKKYFELSEELQNQIGVYSN